MSAALTLLLCILECPKDPDAKADAQLLKGFAHQVKLTQNGGDVQISNLLKACLELEKLGSVAIGQTKNDDMPGTAAGTFLDSSPNRHGPVHVRKKTYLTPHRLREHGSRLTCLLGNPGVVELGHPSDVLGSGTFDQRAKPRFRNCPVDGPYPRGADCGQQSVWPARSGVCEARDVRLWVSNPKERHASINHGPGPNKKYFLCQPSQGGDEVSQGS